MGVKRGREREEETIRRGLRGHRGGRLATEESGQLLEN